MQSKPLPSTIALQLTRDQALHVYVSLIAAAAILDPKQSSKPVSVVSEFVHEMHRIHLDDLPDLQSACLALSTRIQQAASLDRHHIEQAANQDRFLDQLSEGS